MSKIFVLAIIISAIILSIFGVSSFFFNQPQKTSSKVIKQQVKNNIQKQHKINLKKQQFISTLVPIIQAVYKEFYSQYINIKHILKLNKTDSHIEALKKFYKTKTDDELLAALKPHPVSITLAQCAMESAWLTSRFAKEANNIFGVWSFNKNEPRIAASGLRGEKIIYLKKYNNYYESIKDYYKTIGKSWAFKEFRKHRLLTDDPFKLLPYLHKYSEQKDEYPKTLKKVIIKNNFTQYDIKENN